MSAKETVSDYKYPYIGDMGSDIKTIKELLTGQRARKCRVFDGKIKLGEVMCLVGDTVYFGERGGYVHAFNLKSEVHKSWRVCERPIR